jgi:3D (Asp-Asp-Asp) domain-containing protein
MSGAFRTADATVAAKKAATVTASDATVIPVTRALYIGVSGNVSVRMAEDQANQIFANVPVGIFPIQVDMVYATTGGATTATSIVALY